MTEPFYMMNIGEFIRISIMLKNNMNEIKDIEELLHSTPFLWIVEQHNGKRKYHHPLKLVKA